MPVNNRIADISAEIAEIRRDIHAHPELRFEEHRTAALVAERLRAYGCDEVATGVGETGVVGVIRGRAGGRTVAFRADMDALPLTEATGLGHASTVPGKMHACGHDGHTAMLLGAAKYLAETRNFDGTAVLIFQPAEEGSGGARAMIADGVLDRFGVDEIYGMHNWPGLPEGRFAVRTGPQMAAVDFFEIKVQGRGGHGALPQGVVDPVVAASHVVLGLQSIASRNVDPLKTVVVSVCGMRSDSHTYNVIPDAVSLVGTVRYLDPPVQALVRARLTAIAEAAADAYGARAEIIYTERVAPTINAADPADWAAAAAEQVSGPAIRDMDPVMPGEDFSDFLKERPGAFVFVGNGDSADLHNPHYEFNDAIIPAGSSWIAAMAETRMARKGA
jgi:hippurate hydrolase